MQHCPVAEQSAPSVFGSVQLSSPPAGVGSGVAAAVDDFSFGSVGVSGKGRLVRRYGLTGEADGASEEDRGAKNAKDVDLPSTEMHLRVVTSHDAGGQQYPVAEQSAPIAVGPAVHWSFGAESDWEGFALAFGSETTALSFAAGEDGDAFGAIGEP